jgi:hypothetical protein
VGREPCADPELVEPIAGTFWRLVENQEQVATLGYVDSLEEQAMLEALLETAKPPPPPGTENLHYLLRTPFRYPPLPWGSRYGRRHEPGIFYAGLDVATTLGEAAYYRFVFWYSMETPAIDVLRSEHSLFAAEYATGQGVCLQLPPCDSQHERLTHPEDYRATQALGSVLRENGVEAFEYPSARHPGGICVALFTPAALAGTRPREITRWLCEVHEDRVLFKGLESSEVRAFALDDFLYQGHLPLPAA